MKINIKNTIIISVLMVFVLFMSVNLVQAEEEIVIGYTPCVYDTTDYFGQFEMGLRDGLEEAGVSYQLRGRAPLYEADVEGHMAIVEDFVTLGVDYIIFGPVDPETSAPAIKKANEAGIPIIVVNHMEPIPQGGPIEEQEEELGINVLTYCGYSHQKGGEITGEYIVENLLESGDQAAVIYGEPGAPASAERGEPAQKRMEEAGIEIVYTHHAQWERERAYDTTERILASYPDIDLIYGCNSAMAMGAAEAVNNQGMTDQVHVLGFGCVTAEIEMIWEGLITGSIFRNAQSNGRQGAEAIVKHMNGEEVPKQYGMELVVADRNNILEVIPEAQLKMTKTWEDMKKEME